MVKTPFKIGDLCICSLFATSVVLRLAVKLCHEVTVLVIGMSRSDKNTFVFPFIEKLSPARWFY